MNSLDVGMGIGYGLMVIGFLVFIAALYNVLRDGRRK
jgi:cbb3-type cytochrome oxidase subunit 3